MISFGTAKRLFFSRHDGCAKSKSVAAAESESEEEGVPLLWGWINRPAKYQACQVRSRTSVFVSWCRQRIIDTNFLSSSDRVLGVGILPKQVGAELRTARR